MFRISAVIVPVLAAIVVCSRPAPASAQPPGPSGPPLDRVTLQLKWKHQFQFAGYYAAQEKGYYRDAGLEVTIREAPPEGDSASTVLDGEAEFGIASSDLVLLRTQGRPVVALGAIYQHSPLVLLALKRSGIDHVHQLAGKRVMIETHAAELLAYLQYESVPASRMIQVPHSFDTKALQRGEVAAISAYSTDEPFNLREAGEEYLTFSPRAGGIDFYGDTLFTTEEQVRKHPERVRAFLDASLKGWKYALDHPDELVALIHSRYSKRHSREHLKFEAEQTRRLILPDVVEVGYMNPGRWEHILETYVALGMAPAGRSLEGFVYDRNPRPDLTWLYVSLVSALLLVGVVTSIAARFYKLNATIRREAKERLRAEADLRALEQRYRILAENAPFPIIITRTADGTVRYVNPQAAQAFDITQDCAVGREAAEFYVEPEDRRTLAAALERQGYVRNQEVRLKTATDATFWASLSATSIVFEEDPAAFVALMDISERKALETRLQHMAATDDLTGLYNRRRFVEFGTEWVERAGCDGKPLSLLMLDADQFKSINDTYGHEVGDAALRSLAEMLRSHLRDVDIPGRLGGEEFGVILPDTGLEEALRVAERLRAVVERQEIPGAGKRLRLTVSLGAAALDGNSGSLDDLFRRADEALYQAKSNGRNRVECYQPA